MHPERLFRKEVFVKTVHIMAVMSCPRQKDKIETLVNGVLRGARQEGVVVELFSVSDKYIPG